ncbi:hypothetical protein ACI48D_02540 [Massilia sp. LXY-6]|uniref:hypothetical protein n=1 Tax=Massilia sp. LXY-6 TaxID=3379823 RepID=UPI003EE35B31
MADLKEVQALNAERIVSQFLAVQKELRGRVEEGDVDKISATLTAALFSSDAGAKACGVTDGRQPRLAPPRGFP